MGCLPLALAPALPRTASMIAARPRIAGKFLAVGNEKVYVRGVTYGTFALADDGGEQ